MGRGGGGGVGEGGVKKRVDNRWVEMMENKEKMENNEMIEREKVGNSKREKVGMGNGEQGVNITAWSRERVNIATRSLERLSVD